MKISRIETMRMTPGQKTYAIEFFGSQKHVQILQFRGQQLAIHVEIPLENAKNLADDIIEYYNSEQNKKKSPPAN